MPGAGPVSARQVTCPCCGKPARFEAANPHRPFCSARCRTIDLGDWAAERHRIRLEQRPDGDEDNPDAPSKTPDRGEG